MSMLKRYFERKTVYLHEMVLSCVKAYRMHKFVDDDGKELNYSHLTEEALSVEEPKALEQLMSMLRANVVVGEKDDKCYKTVGEFIVDHICVSMYHCRYNGKRELTYERFKMVRRKGRVILNKSKVHKDFFFKIYMIAAKTLGTTLRLMDMGVFDESKK